MQRLPLISFSAIEGNAIGGGAELVTATDFRVVTFGAMIQFVHFKLGASTILGGASRLHQLVGYPKALQLLLSCKKLDGASTYKLGLAQWVCPSGHAVKTCLDVVQGYIDVSVTATAGTDDNNVGVDGDGDGDGDEDDVGSFQDHLPPSCPPDTPRGLASLHAIKTSLSLTPSPMDAELRGLNTCWGGPAHLKAVQSALRRRKAV